MPEQRLFAVFAHPDDESFGCGGMLAKYAAQGVDVHVCTVTDGAAGTYVPNPDRPDAPPDLAGVRQEELECASRILGVKLHRLGYRDSGMEGSPDNRHPDSLYQADLDSVARDLLRLICEIQPQVLVTHDPSGGYFHPDHIRVNHAVTRAWSALSAPADHPGLLPGPDCALWQPERLYYTVLPRNALRRVLLIARLTGQDPRRFGRNHDIDLTRLGVPNSQITVRLDIAPYLALKEQAGACHLSQGGGGAPSRLPAFLRRRAQRYEFYMQAYPPEARKHDDFFGPGL